MSLVDSTLRSYSAILFSDRRSIGVLTLASTFFNWKAGVFGIFAILTANFSARLIGVHEDKIKKGLIGFNALLLGLSFSYYYLMSPSTLFILFIAVMLLIYVNIALDHIFAYFFNLPALSIPFVLVSSISYLAFYNYDGAALVKAQPLGIDPLFPEVHRYFIYYLKSLGAIFFQSSPWAGLVILVALVVSSRIAVLLSFLGFFTGLFFHVALKGDMNDMTGGLVAFNYILTAVALGGIFLVPGPAAFLLSVVAVLATATVASFIKIFFVSFNMPVLTLPFALVTLLFLYCTKLLYNKRLKPVDFLPGSPEHNLDFFLSRQGRFGDIGLDIRLPFWGKWKVSQGYHGEFTHQAEWFASLDFMAVGEDTGAAASAAEPGLQPGAATDGIRAPGEDSKAVRRNQAPTVEDYYTFGLPVLAVAAGTVRKVVQHLDDNSLGEMNLRENWGNLVLIQHGNALFSLVCHLKKNSVLVKEGDYVLAGAKLAQAGNSGRSSEPHIHLHFQATPEIGSATVPVPFTQYVLHNGTSKIRFNATPAEGEVLANLTPDFNLKNFFLLAPGQNFTVQLENSAGRSATEEWTVKVDFLGTRYIENEYGDRLLYAVSNDWFAVLDYAGRAHSALFLAFTAFYRVPFAASAFSYGERISHKHFTRFPLRILKDIALPFTERVSLVWNATPSGTQISSRISAGDRALSTTTAELAGSFPGIVTTEKDGTTWKLSRAA